MTIRRTAAEPRLIPGAFEVRSVRARMSFPDRAPLAARSQPTTSTVADRSLLERLWRYVMRPTDTPPF
jgi:hypothetical protein